MDTTMTPVAAASVRALGAEDLRWALQAGWDDFKAKRGDLILLPFIYPLVGVLASVFAFNSQLFPLIFPLAGGFALVGPIAAAGFYELARRREAHQDSSWWHFLDPLKGRSRLPIATLTAMLVVIFLVWMGSAQAIYTATLGTLAPASPDAFVRDLFGTRQGWTMIVIGNIVGALFAIVTLAVSAFQRNPATMIGWGARVAAILLIAALPLFIGLMVALPVLGYATWHLYTRTVVR
jgi:uncharacterized membrane protein